MDYAALPSYSANVAVTAYGLARAIAMPGVGGPICNEGKGCH